MKTFPTAYLIYHGMFKILPNINKTSKNWHRRNVFFQSDEISPNLVTLKEDFLNRSIWVFYLSRKTLSLLLPAPCSSCWGRNRWDGRDLQSRASRSPSWGLGTRRRGCGGTRGRILFHSSRTWRRLRSSCVPPPSGGTARLRYRTPETNGKLGCFLYLL